MCSTEYCFHNIKIKCPTICLIMIKNCQQIIKINQKLLANDKNEPKNQNN